jgi:hypothetical protein
MPRHPQSAGPRFLELKERELTRTLHRLRRAAIEAPPLLPTIERVDHGEE